jgi:hypothetical protein
VKIKKPSKSHGPKGYYCRKGFFSLNVQAMCDANRRFTFVSVKAAGSTHDSTAMAMSWLGKTITDGAFPRGLCDDAYKGGEQMLVLWPGKDLGCKKDSYNYWQSRMRIEIECAFGVLVRKWLLLGRGIEQRAAATKSAVLHPRMCAPA